VKLSERLKPKLYDLFNAKVEREFGGPKRAQLLAQACGRALEVGVGTGRNIPYYPPAVTELVITDPSEGMLARAGERAREAGRDARAVGVAADALPFPDASFDTVVATLVLCSVPSQERALAEIRRVLKPDGRFLFIEHVRADDPKRARWQDRLEGVWGVMADGCHPNRATLAGIEQAGFAVDGVETGEVPKAPPIVRPYIMGCASPTPRA